MSKMSKRSCFFGLMLVLVPACQSSGPVRVHSYWGTTIERPAMGSVFDWGMDSATHDPTQETHIRTAVREDIEREMTSMGYVLRSGSQNPDLIVSAHWGRGLQPSPSGPEQRAMLAIRIYEAPSGRVVYCASADALIEATLSPETRRERIDLAIHELLRPFAPVGQRCRCGR